MAHVHKVGGGGGVEGEGEETVNRQRAWQWVNRQWIYMYVYAGEERNTWKGEDIIEVKDLLRQGDMTAQHDYKGWRRTGRSEDTTVTKSANEEA